MRKILSICLAVTIIVSLLASVIVSADAYNFSFGTPTDLDDSTVTIPVIVTLPNAQDETWINDVNIKFSCVNCEVEYAGSSITNSTNINGTMNLFDFAAGAQGFQGSATQAAAEADYYGITTTQQKAGYELFTVKVKKLEDNATITFDVTSFISDTETSGYKFYASSSNAETLTLWEASSKEEIPATVNKLDSIVDDKDVEWTFTDAEAYTVSTTGFSKDTYSLVKCDLAIDSTVGAKTGSVEVPINISGGTVTFRALIVGIPDGVTINSVTGVITAE